MEIGLFGITQGPCADPSLAAELAVAAESAGLDSVWAGEHVVAPKPRAAPSPIEPDFPMLDPLVALGFLAASTSTIALASGIVILPQRNPVILAKQVASLSVVSGGRFWLGIGAGYLHQEFDAIGIPFSDRAGRTDEAIEAMQQLWSADDPAYAGDYVSFSGIDSAPRPVGRTVPIHVGGASPGALRRAVRFGAGWYGFGLDVDATRRALATIDELITAGDRPAALGPLEISVSPAARPDAETAQQFEDLGVDRVVWILGGRDADGARRSFDAMSSTV